MLLYSENIEVCNVCQHANRTVNSAITRTNITHHKLNHNSFKNIVNGKRRQEGGSRRGIGGKVGRDKEEQELEG